MAAASHERRLGQRHGDVRFGIGWRLDRVDTRPAQRRLRLPLPPEVGVLVDVSMTGASVLAASARELRVGSRTAISFRGVTGPVIIRRIGPSADPARSIYGVEFAEPNSALPALVYDTFVGDQENPEPSPGEDPRPS